MVEKCRFHFSVSYLTYTALDEQSLNCPNDYFGQLCCDENCVHSIHIQIAEGVEVPKLSDREAGLKGSCEFEENCYWPGRDPILDMETLF